MRGLRTYLVTIFAWLLIASQGAAFAHASTHGTEPHDHDGIACDVTVLEERGDLVLPPPAVPDAPVPDFREAFRSPVRTQTPVTPPPARAPPPRAPPH